MGHCVCHNSFDVNMNKDEIFTILDHNACRESDSRSGLPKKIRYIDVVCKDHDEAVEYIRKHDNGWYDQLAVKYYACVPAKTKKYEQAVQKASALRKEFDQISRMCPVYKSAFVGCKKCGSKISTEHFNGRYCPVCRNDMLCDTDKKKIQRAKEKMIEAEQKVNEAGEKKLMWLVKTEYHV